jgi:UDP-glucuronate 4-epimerase
VKIIITGVAGFIGYFVAKQCLIEGNVVYGIDNLNGYYDIKLKYQRIKELSNFPDFHFYEFDIKDTENLSNSLGEFKPEVIIHLAAQAGVRYSIENPQAYVDSNLVGFMNILEACRKYPVKHLIYASSSSVYGGNHKTPFSTNDNVDHPVSLYAATKKANELLAHSYSHLYGIPTTGLRFFTVYGPYGRPDMAYFRSQKISLKANQLRFLIMENGARLHLH